ncbi:tetratricopeptide repeat protein [Catenovulum sediminis]|uniref:Sel1 repeat family protein n=1 Tax=Catenovulum sediminis TaxID=1740262 RepID=A0ABV1RIV6_9ALTE
MSQHPIQENKIDWITLEQASEITGASLAIIQDTFRKYQDNPKALKTQSIDGEIFVDKRQIINLFPASATVVEKEKIPGTLFRWFDDLRRAYETSLNTMFKRVEAVKDEHKNDLESAYKQQIALLEKKHQQQIKQFAIHYKQQMQHLQSSIHRLEKDAEFYQNQIVTQQDTIAKLNSRYDAVILALKNKGTIAEKDITPDNNLLAGQADQSEQNKEKIPPAEETHKNTVPNDSESLNEEIDKLLEIAFHARDEKDYSVAVKNFELAAFLGSSKAMGALGRCYFVGEGVEKNIEKGIAWLYLASEYHFEPAKIKIQQVQIKHPEEYTNALQLADALAIQIKLKQTQIVHDAREK